MNIHKGTVFVLIAVVLLAIPIVWLALQVRESVPLLVPIIILGSFVIVTVIVRKTSYKPFQQPYQHESVYAVRRIEKAFASGAAAMFVLGFITMSFIRPLLPGYFWVIYLAILFVIGAIIGDTLDYR
jgi:hypothetical protein